LLTNNGYPLLGAILTTFPIGIMAMLSVKNSSLRNKLLNNILTGNVVIVFTWLAIYYYSKYNTLVSNDTLGMIGLLIWVTLSFVYFVYLYLYLYLDSN
tara:strand:+ start:1120 stop:1413 length:294 start_codon:yes stop_codon:yes gene_type:complete